MTFREENKFGYAKCCGTCLNYERITGCCKLVPDGEFPDTYPPEYGRCLKYQIIDKLQKTKETEAT